MASNIKIIGNIVSTTSVSRYSSQDAALIASKNLQENFGGEGDYIEYFAYNIGGNLLNTNYNYLSYKLPPNQGLTPGTSTPPNTTGNIQTTDVGVESTLSTPTSSLYPIIEIDPVNDLQNLGYSSGEFQVRYNFFQSKISDYFNQGLFIKEISQDRTEIRVASTTLTNEQIESGSLALIDKINNTQDYYVDYILNFGDNNQFVTINVALDKTEGGFEILFKLYQPLPLSIQEKQTLWVVEEIVNPYVFDVDLNTLISPPPPPTLRGPNFTIPIENQGTISTSYNNYSGLITSLKTLQNSSYNQIQSLLATQSIDINVDYTDFDNFVFFSSAYQRVTNFYTKVKEIEDYNNFINTYTPFVITTASLQTTINQYKTNINDTISQFDGYEYYLYFESSSYAWPKSGSLKPFSLLSTGSAIVNSWYNNLTGSALYYDRENYNNLEFTIPSFIRDNEDNQPFLLFLNMVGQYFDNIWIYLKAITDVNLANNNLDYGISRDLVYQQLKSLGVKLYNSQAGNSVPNYLIGANTGSSIFPYTPVAGNDFSITGSYLNNIPRADLVAELYKRIYHNLPLLLKTKGTVAGLDYLMSTFGMPNQTYYTIGNETFYTPTGSAVTASLLNVKEFGGSLKSELINGYNNDKVRIVNNTITGSVLSSELSLQTFPTASSAFRDDDLHYVDISFSPQSQIDTYISGAIASNNPTWSLDDYIGDPRQQYSGSYSDLDVQRKLYFETGVPGFNPFTASLLDYNGFIRLIEYFDNSLFKMLNDFVPERTSLSTGVTINSPVLERNKAVYSVPTANNQQVFNAEYPTSSIGGQYGEFYEALQGDKKPYFTGELSGSIVDINQYFKDDFNPYDGDWNVWNLQHIISESIDLNKFLHSDWNVLLNNVSKSVTSNYRKHIEYIYGTTGSITSSAQLQDSYLTLRSYNTSRYDGSKVTSLLYNTYTSASYTGSNGLTVVTGDKSFGKTAAIDHNSYKIGWVKNIPSQSLNFYDKTSINLKYLVDSKNEITELSRANFNWEEVQRIFKSGDPVALSISDVKIPSNQTTLDGNKTIWKGGYSYDPIIFREANETLYFSHDNYISSSIGYLGIKAYCNDAYSYQSYQQFNAGFQCPPTLPATNGTNASNGQYKYEINRIDGATTQGLSISYKFDNSTSWRYRNSSNFINWNNPFSNIRYNGQYAYSFNNLNFNNTGSGYNTEPLPTTYSPLSVNGNYIYKVQRSSDYQFKGQIPFSFYGNDEGIGGQVAFKVVGIVEKSTTPNIESSWQFIANTVLTADSLSSNVGYNQNYNAIVYDDNMGDWSTFYCNLNATATLIQGEYIRFQTYILDLSNLFGNPNGGGTQAFSFIINGSPANKALNDGYFEIYDSLNQIPIYYYTSSYGQIPPLFQSSSSNTILFNSSSYYLFNTSSSFVPSLPASENYSPVVDYFGIKKFDLLRLGSFTSPTSEYYEIISTGITGSPSQIYAVLDKPIVTSSYNNGVSFALLRPKPNETSVIINYKKQLGEVSQTILIPQDANDSIKNSIGNIFKTLNTDLQ